VRYVSTRRRAEPSSFSAAILAGLAPDGGLFVPDRFPAFDAAPLTSVEGFASFASHVLRPFLEGDALGPELDGMCMRAFDFPVPLVELRRDTAVLELFHGPTAAFKDFGARFLAECLEHTGEAGSGRGRPLTILVATSGDTGGAVAAAFHRRPGIRVAILYPRGGVSSRQEQQLTCWGENVTSFSVAGNFDDCQRLVKAAFRDERMNAAHRLTSANSINIGRLLPQAAYYAAASVWYRERTGSDAGFIVPAGNVGNAVGAFWARKMGFPIREIALATNANRVIPDWFVSVQWKPRPSVATLANAMDVGDPSNMERLFDLFPRREDLLRVAQASSVGDRTIREVIAAGPDAWGRVWCPHTATAVHLREQLDSPHWVVVATAHPAKFETIVEPLVGHSVEPPQPLADLLDRPRHVLEIDADLEALRQGLDA
jgi:threonine synthase